MLLSSRPNLQQAMKPFMFILQIVGVIAWTGHMDEEKGNKRSAISRVVQFFLLAAVLTAVTVPAIEELTSMISDIAASHGLSTLTIFHVIYNLRWIVERLAQYSCIILAYRKIPHLQALVGQFSTEILKIDGALKVTFPLQLPFFVAMVLFIFIPELWIRVRSVLQDEHSLAQNGTLSLATFATPGWMLPLRTRSPVVYHLLVGFALRSVGKLMETDSMAIICTAVYALTCAVEHCTSKARSLTVLLENMAHTQRVEEIHRLRSQIGWISHVFSQYNRHCSLFILVFCTCDLLVYLGDITWITDPSLMSSDMFCSSLMYELQGLGWDCLLIVIHLRSTKAADNLERCMKELLITYCNVLWTKNGSRRKDKPVSRNLRLADSPETFPVDHFCVQNWLDTDSLESPAASIGSLGQMRVYYLFSVLLSCAGFVIFLYELQKV